MIILLLQEIYLTEEILCVSIILLLLLATAVGSDINVAPTKNFIISKDTTLAHNIKISKGGIVSLRGRIHLHSIGTTHRYSR